MIAIATLLYNPVWWLSWWRYKMEPFPRYWPFVRGIHRSSVNSPHKGQWRGALMFSVICAWKNGLANNETPVIWDAIALIMALHNADITTGVCCGIYWHQTILKYWWFSARLQYLQWQTPSPIRPKRASSAVSFVGILEKKQWYIESVSYCIVPRRTKPNTAACMYYVIHVGVRLK